jgi:hypothetical protein
VLGTHEFERRSALYARLDEELFNWTRFFGAAALTNAVLAQFFRLTPRVVPRSCEFLRQLGSVLEAANLQYAAAIKRQAPASAALDCRLVRSEQRLVQCWLVEQQARADSRWDSIRGEINGVLNECHFTSVFSRCFARSRYYYGVLRRIRRETGVPFDFASESHRVRIGLGLVERIRSEG